MGTAVTRRRKRSASSDAALIDRARDGDLEAYGQLFERHSGSARALARQLSNSTGEADDAVSEAFERVLGAIRRGTGPRDSFRPYLLTTIRRTTYDRTRREQRTGPTSDEWILDQGVEDEDPSLAAFEREAMTRAFESLPERWQTVLWHTEVEETPPEDLATMLGVRPNALAALAYRAREGLRQAYVLAHVDIDLREPLGDCRWTIDRLPKYIRGRVSDEAELKVERHLDSCEECRTLYFEMADVGVSLRAAMVPLVFGGPSVLAAIKALSDAGASAGVASIASSAAGSGAAAGAASAGAAAAGTGSVVASVAAATVAATVGGTLVLPTVTTLAVNAQAPEPVSVVAASGQTTAAPGDAVTVPIKVAEAIAPPGLAMESAAPAPRPAAPAAAPVEEVAAPAPVPTTAAPEPSQPPASGAFEPDAEVEPDEPGEGDIGSPLIITPPAPTPPGSGGEAPGDGEEPDDSEGTVEIQPIGPVVIVPVPSTTLPPSSDGSDSDGSDSDENDADSTDSDGTGSESGPDNSGPGNADDEPGDVGDDDSLVIERPTETSAPPGPTLPPETSVPSETTVPPETSVPPTTSAPSGSPGG